MRSYTEYLSIPAHGGPPKDGLRQASGDIVVPQLLQGARIRRESFVLGSARTVSEVLARMAGGLRGAVKKAKANLIGGAFGQI